MFRKPMEGTTIENVLEHGVGGLNIDGCRLHGKPKLPGNKTEGSHRETAYQGQGKRTLADRVAYQLLQEVHDKGRWPPNVTLAEAAAQQLDAMVGKRTSGALPATTRRGWSGRTHGKREGCYGERDQPATEAQGPSEFFYCPKASTRERDQGCEHLRWMRTKDGWRAAREGETPDLVGNCHPTTKPLALMRWLLRLVTPPGGHVLEPFMGSGTTGVGAVREGFNFTGCDITPWAFAIAEARIRWAQGRGPAIEDLPQGVSAQGSLF
jgi:site-specific DNA-methyltransferase (adenine-specific)